MNIVFETEFILATRKDSRGSGAKDLSQTINNNRINVRINNEVTYHYDLNYTRPSGQFHRGIPVPHITRSNLNISPKGTFYNQDNTWVRSATHHDIEFLLKVLKIK